MRSEIREALQRHIDGLTIPEVRQLLRQHRERVEKGYSDHRYESNRLFRVLVDNPILAARLLGIPEAEVHRPDDEDVLGNLCCNDRRNPAFDSFWFDDDDPPAPRDNCSCDNCFYGRDRLALEIIRLRELAGDPLCPENDTPPSPK